MEVGEQIEAMRVHFGMSKAELARKARMAESSLYRIETARRSPNLETLSRIVGALNVIAITDRQGTRIRERTERD